MPTTPPQPSNRQQQPPQATHQQRSATGLRPSPSLTSPLAPRMVRQSSWGGSGSGSMGDGEAQALLPPLPPLNTGAAKGGSSSSGGGRSGGDNAFQSHFPQRSRSQTYIPQGGSYRSLEVSPVPDNAPDNTDKVLVPRNGSSSARRSAPTPKAALVEKTTKGDRRTLYLSFLCMVAVGIGNRIYGKLETLPMHNYAFFQNALMNFIYVPMCFLYILPMLWCGSSITKQQTSVPKLKFAIMGLFDSVAGMMQTFAVNYIPSGALIVLLSQASIPISMYISKVSLGATYSRSQYTGAVIVLLGIVVVLLPTFIVSSSSPSRPPPPSAMSSPPSSSSRPPSREPPPPPPPSSPSSSPPSSSSSPSSPSSSSSPSPPSSKSPPPSSSSSAAATPSSSSSSSRPSPSSMASPLSSSSPPSSSPQSSASSSSSMSSPSSPSPPPSSMASPLSSSSPPSSPLPQSSSSSSSSMAPPPPPSSPSSSTSPPSPRSSPHTPTHRRSRTSRVTTPTQLSAHTAAPRHHNAGDSESDTTHGGGGGVGVAAAAAGGGGGGGGISGRGGRGIEPQHRGQSHAAHPHTRELSDRPSWHLQESGGGQLLLLNVPSCFFASGGNSSSTVASLAAATLACVASRRAAARGRRGTMAHPHRLSHHHHHTGLQLGDTTTARPAMMGEVSTVEGDVLPLDDHLSPSPTGARRSVEHQGAHLCAESWRREHGSAYDDIGPTEHVRVPGGDRGAGRVRGRGGEGAAPSFEGERDGGSGVYGDATGPPEVVRVGGGDVDGHGDPGGVVVRRRLRARTEGATGKDGGSGGGSRRGAGGGDSGGVGGREDGGDGHDPHDDESGAGNVHHHDEPVDSGTNPRGERKDDGADTAPVGGNTVEGGDTPESLGGNTAEGDDDDDTGTTGYTYNSHDEEDMGEQEEGGRAPLLWVGVMILSMVPATLSSVYKEMALGETDIDVIYLNGWVSVFQFLFNVPMVLPSAWITNLRTRDIPQNLWDGARCYWGQNSVVVGTETMPADDCRMAFFYTNTYLAFNIVYNVLSIVILKHGSSNILYLASTVMVPINNLAFSLKIVPGHQPVHPTDLLGLVVIMAGLLVYRFFSPLRKWVAVRGVTLSDKQVDVVREMEKVSRAVSSRHVAYLGLNQTELLCGPVLDHRVQKAQQERVQRLLARSPSDIRGSFLLRLGIPPTQALEARARRYSAERSPVLPSYKGGPSTTYSPKASTLVRPAHAATKVRHARSRSLPPSPTEDHLVQPV